MTFKVDECFEHGELNEALAQHGSDVGIAVKIQEKLTNVSNMAEKSVL